MTSNSTAWRAERLLVQLPTYPEAKRAASSLNELDDDATRAAQASSLNELHDDATRAVLAHADARSLSRLCIDARS